MLNSIKLIVRQRLFLSKLLNSVKIANLNNLCTQVKLNTNKNVNINDDLNNEINYEDQFGIGTKYLDFDSKISKHSSHEAKNDDSDTFGTLTDNLNDM